MSDIEDNESDDSFTVEDDAKFLTIDVQAGEIQFDTLPVKSRQKYLKIFEAFEEWRMKQKPSDITENLMLLYMEKMSKDYKARTVLSFHSQLKAVIKVKFNINIELYEKINHFIKKIRVGYQPTQPCDFTAKDIRKFLIEAPDGKYLPHKVALIFSSSGVYRGSQLHNLSLSELKDRSNKVMELTLLDTKNRDKRTLTIEKPWSDFVKKYYNLRPENTITERFFLNYRNGKCTVQHIGKNTIGSWPREIATYLKLPNPEEYKGQSFGRISAAVLADGGGGMSQEKISGGWEFVSTSESYVENSNTSQEGIYRKIQDLNEEEEEDVEIPADKSKMNSPDDELDESSNQEAEEIQFGTIPVKSRQKYLKIFEAFDDWRMKQNSPDITENLMFSYFEKLSKEYQANSVISFHSQLKAVIKAKFDINIEVYDKINHFLKTNRIGYHPTQPSDFTAEDIKKFLNEAPDEKYLPHKVALIIGSNSARRGSLLHNLNLKGLKEIGNKVIELTLFDTKNGDNRCLTLEKPWSDLVKKYYNLRPENAISQKFFLNYQNGKCTVQNIGKNKIASWPREIATYLKLPNPEKYKGHSFRRISPTILSECGGSWSQKKTEGDWEFVSVAETYEDDSTTSRTGIYRKVQNINEGEEENTEITPERSKLITPDDDEPDESSCQQTEEILFRSIPVKSQQLYLRTFQAFEDWRMKQNPPDISETLMFEYMEKLSKEYKANTVISFYSQLKTVIKAKYNINIVLYKKINHFLKINKIGYRPIQPSVFSAKDIKKFFNTAPDEKYLPHKVALIIGSNSARRGSRLHDLNLKGLKELGNKVVELTLFDTKNGDKRTFTLEKPWSDFVKKYHDLRPKNSTSQRFFLNFQNGKCTVQNIGKNKIASWPLEIATFLELPSPEKYKGHSIRLISADVLADCATSILQEERMGDWEFVSVAEPYVENSTSNEREISEEIQNLNEEEEEDDEIPAKRSKLNSPVDELDESSSQESEEIQSAIIPVKSQQKYLRTFQAFDDWRMKQNPSDITENLMFIYMKKLSKKYIANSVNSFHSQLKAVIKSKFNINIELYEKVNNFLKNNRLGYQPTNPFDFTAEDIRKFLFEAPDEKYLPHKVSFIIGTSSACRGSLLHNLNLSGLEEIGNKVIELTLFDTKNGDNRTFVLEKPWSDFVKKYYNLRPENTIGLKFFLKFQNGKCTFEDIGKNTIANWPREIATYLKLPNSENYKGHSFRKITAEVLTEIGGSMIQKERMGGWEFVSVPESHVENSTSNRRESTRKKKNSNEGEDENDEIPAKRSKLNSSDDEYDEAEETQSATIPVKSQHKYLKTFKAFDDWRMKQDPSDITENLMFEYMEKLSKEYKANSVISFYSQLKTVLKANFNINIELFEKINHFIKMTKMGYQPTQPCVFSEDEIEKFLNIAPDEKYLPHKVALIIASCGACRESQLQDLHLSGLRELGNKVMELTLLDITNDDKRTFTLVKSWYDFVKKYHSLRPKNSTSQRLFLNFQNGKCTVQNIGKNKIASWPQEIATYLELPNPEKYRGNSFRLISAKVLADSEGTILEEKRIKGWESTGVAGSYVENSTTSRREMSERIPNSNDEEEENCEITAEECKLTFSDGELDESSNQQAEDFEFSTIPVKSQRIYLKTFRAFEKWRNQQNPPDITEHLMSVYFEKLSKEYKANTVVSFHSHLKAVIKEKYDINIEVYDKINHFLKSNKIGYQPSQASVFTTEDIETFLNTAPDEKYLPHKVALIIGSNSACQESRLHDLHLGGPEVLDNKVMELTLFDTKNCDNRTFILEKSWYDFVKKYHDLRPKHTTSPNFFLHFRNGKCTVQNISRNTIASWPREIANYLKLPNPENYKGYSFHRTATVLADSEGTTLEERRIEGWESTSVTESSLEN